MNIDNLISSFDFDKLKSDCLVHSFLKTYIKKNPNLPSHYDSDFLELYLKNAVCFPSECANCVGMNNCDIRKFVYIPNSI
jgi:hypothetical protein